MPSASPIEVSLKLGVSSDVIFGCMHKRVRLGLGIIVPYFCQRSCLNPLAGDYLTRMRVIAWVTSKFEHPASEIPVPETP